MNCVQGIALTRRRLQRIMIFFVIPVLLLLHTEKSAGKVPAHREANLTSFPRISEQGHLHLRCDADVVGLSWHQTRVTELVLSRVMPDNTSRPYVSYTPYNPWRQSWVSYPYGWDTKQSAREMSYCSRGMYIQAWTNTPTEHDTGLYECNVTYKTDLYTKVLSGRQAITVFSGSASPLMSGSPGGFVADVNSRVVAAAVMAVVVATDTTIGFTL